MAEEILPDGGIYSIKHIPSGKQYVGSAKSVKKRWRLHKSDLNLGRHVNRKLQGAWAKYGESEFEFSVIERIYRCEDLVPREQHWMDLLDPWYNIAKIAGSQLGLRHSDESKARMSVAQRAADRNITPRTRQLLSESGKAQVWSEDRKRKIGDALRGLKLSEERRRQISLSQKGRVISKETREKMSASRMGHKVSEETRRKISIAKSGKPPVSRRPHSEETKAKLSAAAKKRGMPRSVIEASANATRGEPQSPELVAKRAAAIRAYHAKRKLEFAPEPAGRASPGNSYQQ